MNEEFKVSFIKVNSLATAGWKSEHRRKNKDSITGLAGSLCILYSHQVCVKVKKVKTY